MEMNFQAYFGIAVVFLFCLMLQSQAQNSECMNQLLPCSDYMNSNRDPPDSCCQPLKYVIEREPECLCSMMTVQGANRAEQAGINLTEVQTLPARCGQRINPLGCVVGSPNQNAASSRTASKIAVAVSSMIVHVIWKLHVFA